jgi:hypothetical protein
MIILATLLLLLPIVLFVYAYFGYPFILRRLGGACPIRSPRSIRRSGQWSA